MCRRLVLFRSTAGVTTTQLEQAATQLETYLNERFVHALVRQQDSQPDEVAVLVANKSKLDKAVKVLTDEGYESGPATGPELTLSEGQPLTVRFRGNISEAEGRSVSYVWQRGYKIRIGLSTCLSISYRIADKRQFLSKKHIFYLPCF